MLFGDYNARTKNLNDYIEVDEFLCNANDSNDIFAEYEKDKSYFYSPNSKVTLKRTNADGNCNNYGYKLVEFCKKGNNMYILNGRAAHDSGMGNPTCKNVSTVDYFISSPNIIPFISDFHVYGFSSILSDVHCPVALQLIINDSNTKKRIDNRHLC